MVKPLVAAGAFARRAWLEATHEPVPSALQLVSFTLGLLSQAFLGRFVDAAPNSRLGPYAGHYAAFLILGMALLDLQNAVVSGLARRIREAQLTGSLEAMLATPTPTPVILFGLALPDVAGSLARMIVYALVGAFWFGFDLRPSSPLAAGCVLVLAIAAFAGLALAGASLTMALRRADPLNLFVAATAVIAGGVFYPRSVLPAPVAQIGALLPIAPALDALRAAFVPANGPVDVTTPLVRLAIVAAVLLPSGALLFARALRRARADGSLTAP